MASRRILIVDDEENIGRSLRMILGREGYGVNVCKSVAEGTFKPGTVVLGLKEDGVGMSEMKYTKKDVPPALLAKVDTLKKAIIEGKLKPPATAAELSSFQPPK